MKRFLTLIFSVLIMTGCSLYAQFQAARHTLEADIAEVIFREEFEELGSPWAKTYCIALLVDGRRVEPSNEFLARFADYPKPIKKWSDCVEGEPGGLVDKQTGVPARVFHAGVRRWCSGTSVQAEGGYYGGLNSAAAFTYCVFLEKGTWTLKRGPGWVASL